MMNIRNVEFRYYYGTWLATGSPVVTEIASLFPFDWMLLDMEHGAFSESAILPNLQAVQNNGPSVIVRIPFDINVISRVLDWGAKGIMIPHVSDAEKAMACVRALHYPPMGNRGFSSSVRAYQYGMMPPDDMSLIKPLLFAQIETTQAVKNAEQIAGVDGVDVLFVGPSDLKLSLRAQTGSDTISYKSALESVAQAAKLNGKKAGILVRDFDEIKELKKLGYSCFALNSDIAIIRNGFKEISKHFLND